jgi:hypothetical protein
MRELGLGVLSTLFVFEQTYVAEVFALLTGWFSSLGLFSKLS